jgi:hypothetical protein
LAILQVSLLDRFNVLHKGWTRQAQGCRVPDALRVVTFKEDAYGSFPTNIYKLCKLIDAAMPE